MMGVLASAINFDVFSLNFTRSISCTPEIAYFYCSPPAWFKSRRLRRAKLCSRYVLSNFTIFISASKSSESIIESIRTHRSHHPVVGGNDTRPQGGIVYIEEYVYHTSNTISPPPAISFLLLGIRIRVLFSMEFCECWG